MQRPITALVGLFLLTLLGCELSYAGQSQHLSEKFLHGARLTFATAYQSCDPLRMAPITHDMPDLRGIVIKGVAQDGGDIRKITDLNAFIESNPYYHGYKKGPNCTDVRKQPLIYNFGGRPSNIPFQDNEFQLDLFHMEPGYGDSREAGIDCSGFIATAMAVGGVRLRTHQDIQTDDIYHVNSYQFMGSDINGYDCLEKSTMGVSGSLKAGDILAMSGHIVLIESVGRDPLGILRSRSPSACDEISSDNFDFVVMQSSSTKDGLGLNRFKGSELMLDIESFKVGLESFAKQACHAKLRGLDIQPYNPHIQLLRLRDDPDCEQYEVPLVGQSCVQACVP